VLIEFYEELIRLRKIIPALASLSREQMKVTEYEEEQVLLLRRWSDNSEVFAVFSFGDRTASLVLPVPRGQWGKLFDSADKRWEGAGTSLPDTLYSEGEAPLTLSPLAVALFVREERP
jgi:maltooligosyltrehalose trehalohydrolase